MYPVNVLKLSFTLKLRLRMCKRKKSNKNKYSFIPLVAIANIYEQGVHDEGSQVRDHIGHASFILSE